MQKTRFCSAIPHYISNQGKAHTLATDLRQKLRGHTGENQNLSKEELGPGQMQTVLLFTIGPVPYIKKVEKSYQNPFAFCCVFWTPWWLRQRENYEWWCVYVGVGGVPVHKRNHISDQVWNQFRVGYGLHYMDISRLPHYRQCWCREYGLYLQACSLHRLN